MNMYTVRERAKGIIFQNAPYYDFDLLKLLPLGLAWTVIDLEKKTNYHGLMLEIDEIRFKLEDQLAEILGLDIKQEKHRKKLTEILNDLRQVVKLKRQIKFLYNLAVTIIYQ